MAGRIISITQQKGGSGKTTISAHLAIAFAEGEASVAVLDTDPQGSLGEWFEKRERTLGEDGTGISFRTASGWGARREAQSLARDHAIVLIDTPPKSDIEARHAIEAADLVVVPVQPSPVDVWATAATLQMIGREGRRSLLVINRVPPRAALTGQMLDAVTGLGWTAAAARIGNRIAFAQSMGLGRTVTETEASGRAAAEIRALAAEIAGLLAR